MIKQLLVLGVACVVAQNVNAQGQDSQTSERDLLVIQEMLTGVYDNANQAYFDGRRGLDSSLRHGRMTVSFERTAETTFSMLLDRHDGSAGERYQAQLQHLFELNQVAMTLSKEKVKGDAADCEYRWERGPEHFVAKRIGECATGFASSLSLSKQFLWLDFKSSSPYSLHRTRAFTCYADMPGVGGGRDIPFERYENFKLHDRGGSVWFDTKATPEQASRRLGISLLLVDWPINNYKGAFARDSLVVYVSEKIGDEVIEHGYSFTVPEANRIGVNLKWMLVNCYQVSPADATPEMYK